MDKILKITQKLGSTFIGVEAKKEGNLNSFAYKVNGCKEVKIGDVILATKDKSEPIPFKNMNVFLKFKDKLNAQEVTKKLEAEGKHFNNETTDIFW